MSASQRRKQFLRTVEDLEPINAVRSEKGERNVWRLSTDSGSKLLWIHYNKHFKFFGGAWTKNTNLAKGNELVHAFIGGGSGEYYIVPDADLHSGDFSLPTQKKGGGHWKLEKAYGKPSNGTVLEQGYTNLSLLYE